MAEAIGVKRVTISAYENDRITPSPEMVVLIADFLGVTPELFTAKHRHFPFSGHGLLCLLYLLR